MVARQNLCTYESMYSRPKLAENAGNKSLFKIDKVSKYSDRTRCSYYSKVKSVFHKFYSLWCVLQNSHVIRSLGFLLGHVLSFVTTL